ncbi:MAG: class I SAM-dependent methyltransferase [Pseudomonadota bacterium]
MTFEQSMSDYEFASLWQSLGPDPDLSQETALTLCRVVFHLVHDQRPGAYVDVGAKTTAIRIISAAAGAAGVDMPRFFAFTPTGETRQPDDDAADAGRSLSHVVGTDMRTFTATATGIICLICLNGLSSAETRAALEALYPRLVPGGVIIVDGVDNAVAEIDAYLETLGPRVRHPLVLAAGSGQNVCIKPPSPPPAVAHRYDYVPPHFQDPELLSSFPSLLVTDPGRVKWPWLRQNTPHLWRTDGRSSKSLIGVLSYEEAIVLHNLALPFAGSSALEIGCHLAWSTAHLRAADLHLDVIDPALGVAEHLSAVEDSLAASRSNAPAARLYAGYSPSIVSAVAAARAEPWSFAFIDGWHDGDGPLNDAQAVLPHMAEDAMVVFHDLLCPAVAAAVNVFENDGWHVRIMNTSQVMACCWRGAVEPATYEPDPNMPIPILGHIRK